MAIQAALLGYGVVGSGVAEVLAENAASIARNAGQPIELKYIFCRSDHTGEPFADRIVHDFSIIESDPEIEIVAECIGGSGVALDMVRRSLQAGKHVVTSNKEMVAAYGHELLAIAKEKNVNFLFEGSVGGGIPIIRPITQCLAANELDEVYGIINGTTNYILTQMIVEGASFEDALADAQRLGYAEADPTADVEGIDAGRKICILADLCFGHHISPELVRMCGISGVHARDIKYSRRVGYKIKLLGRALRTGPNTVTAYVEPHLINIRSLLSNVDGVMNGIVVRGNALGECMFYGAGAGKRPTASAVVADMIDCAKHRENRMYLNWDAPFPGHFTGPDDLVSRWYVRTGASLAAVGGAFGNVRLINRESDPDDEYAFLSAPMSGHMLRNCSRGMDIRSAFRVLD